MKWLGGLLGAVAGPVLVVVVFLVLYNPPGHDNWDFITPVLFLAAIPMAVVFGAGGGAILGGRLSEGRQRDAVYTGLSTVGIITLLPLAVLFGFPLYFAVRGSPEFVPADEDDRQEWAAYQQGDRDDGYNPDGLEEGAGLALEIADCM